MDGEQRGRFHFLLQQAGQAGFNAATGHLVRKGIDAIESAFGAGEGEPPAKRPTDGQRTPYSSPEKGEPSRTSGYNVGASYSDNSPPAAAPLQPPPVVHDPLPADPNLEQSRAGTEERDMSNGGAAGSRAAVGVFNVETTPPEYIPEHPTTLKTIFRKKNRFTVNVKDFTGPPGGLDPNGFLDVATNIIPWRSSACYMNDAEADNLWKNSAKYRYIRCAHKLSNFTTHSGFVSGSDKWSIQYGGITCYSGTTDEQHLGNYGMFNSPDGVAMNRTTHSVIKDFFSASYRMRGFRPWPCKLMVRPKVYASLNGPVRDHFAFTFDPIDHCTTTVGQLPDTTFSHTFPERWRSEWSAPGEMWYKDPQTAQPFVNASGGAAFSDGTANGKTAIMGLYRSVGTGKYEDVCPPIPAQQSIFHPSANNTYDRASLMDDTTQVSMPVFMFGFMVPLPPAALPDVNIFVSFEIESELEVEYVPMMTAIGEVVRNRQWYNKANTSNFAVQVEDINVIGTAVGRASDFGGTAREFVGLEVNRTIPVNFRVGGTDAITLSGNGEPHFQGTGNLGFVPFTKTDINSDNVLPGLSSANINTAV